jgi:hypothetical protein
MDEDVPGDLVRSGLPEEIPIHRQQQGRDQDGRKKWRKIFYMGSEMIERTPFAGEVGRLKNSWQVGESRKVRREIMNFECGMRPNLAFKI